MPLSNASNCCKCLAGPWLHELYASCIECNHQLCSSCTPVYIKSTQGPRSQQAISKNLRKKHHTLTAPPMGKGWLRYVQCLMDIQHDTKKSRRRDPLILTGGSSSFAAPSSDIGNQSYLPPECLGPHAPVCTFSVTVRALPAPSDGVEFWKCCDCGNGPMTVANHAACPECHHTKCGSCELEER